MHGGDKFIVLFGGWDIEMACFIVLGEILRESGWTHSLIEANLATSGIVDFFLVYSTYLEHAFSQNHCMCFVRAFDVSVLRRYQF